MKVNLVKFNHNIGDYPVVNGRRQTAHITLKYKNKRCMTSVLPTDIPRSTFTTTMQLNSQGALGDCWNMDVSSGEDKMVMELKLPANSPIAVSKVKVFDQSNTARCWTSYWRNKDSNYKKQTNQWVVGKADHETRFGISDNFNEDCTF